MKAVSKRKGGRLAPFFFARKSVLDLVQDAAEGGFVFAEGLDQHRGFALLVPVGDGDSRLEGGFDDVEFVFSELVHSSVLRAGVELIDLLADGPPVSVYHVERICQ